MSDASNNPEIEATARALRELQPVSAAVNRDAIMYRAGQASAARRQWFWPAATATMMLVAICLGAVLAMHSPMAAQERIVYVYVPQSTEFPSPLAGAAYEQVNPAGSEAQARLASSEPATSPISYVLLREQVSRHGVDALPDAPSVMRIASPSGDEPQSWRKSTGEHLAPRF